MNTFLSGGTVFKIFSVQICSSFFQGSLPLRSSYAVTHSTTIFYAVMWDRLWGDALFQMLLHIRGTLSAFWRGWTETNKHTELTTTTTTQLPPNQKKEKNLVKDEACKWRCHYVSVLMFVALAYPLFGNRKHPTETGFLVCAGMALATD